MTKGQFVVVLITSALIVLLAVSAYMLSHRYQVTASKDFMYVLDTFNGDIFAYSVAPKHITTFEEWSLHKIGTK